MKISVEIDSDDALLVGVSLRMLARVTPSPDPTCGERFHRVGTALVEAAQTETRKELVR